MKIKELESLEPIEIGTPRELLPIDIDIKSIKKHRVLSWHPCIYLLYVLLGLLSFILGYLAK